MNIGATVKRFIPKPSTLAGLAALGYVAYDAHYVGKMQADLYSSEKDAGYCGYFLNNAMQNTSMSKVQDAIKDASFTTELDTTWKRFFNEGIGYVKGFSSMLVDHVVPLALGLGAVFGKGIVKSSSAIGVGIYGAYIVLKNFFGIGTPPGLNDLH